MINEDIRVETKPGQRKVEIDDAKPLEYTLNSQKKCKDTEETYNEFAKLKLLPDTYVRHFTVTISQKKIPDNYMEISTAKVPWDADHLQATVDLIRDSAFKDQDVEVEFEFKTILFVTGAAFKQWVEQNKLDARELAQKGALIQ